MARISLPKKILFTSIIFGFFLLIIEGFLTALPYMMSVSQRGQFSQIIEGGTIILCLGDSVTAGFGLAGSETDGREAKDDHRLEYSYPGRLQSMLQDKGAGNIQVINHASSGDDSADMFLDSANLFQKVSDKNSTPVVLLMAGHNDLIGIGWRRWSASGSNVSTAPKFKAPRIVRVLRWAKWTFERSDEVSQAEPVAIPEGFEERLEKARKSLEENIKRFDARVERYGGRLYLLT